MEIVVDFNPKLRGALVQLKRTRSGWNRLLLLCSLGICFGGFFSHSGIISGVSYTPLMIGVFLCIYTDEVIISIFFLADCFKSTIIVTAMVMC